MDDYAAFVNKYPGNIDSYLLRAKASFMADFYMGVEKILKLIGYRCIRICWRGPQIAEATQTWPKD